MTAFSTFEKKKTQGFEEYLDLRFFMKLKPVCIFKDKHPKCKQKTKNKDIKIIVEWIKTNYKVQLYGFFTMET